MNFIEIFKKYKPAIYMCLTIAVAGSVGAVGGWFMGNYFKPVVLTEGNEITIDDELYKNFENFVKNNGNDLSSIDLTNQNEFSIPEIASIALYKFCYINDNSTFYSFCRADSLGINVQYTITSWQKRGSNFLKEVISESSFVYFADRTYNFNETSGKTYENQYDTYHVIGSENVQVGIDKNENPNVNYSNAKETKRTIQSFINRFALNPNYVSNYLLNNDTTDFENELNFTSTINKDRHTYKTNLVKNADNSYTLILALNNKACESYARYMQTTTEDFSIAKMNEPPDFDNVGIKFILDDELNLINGEVDESYLVHTNLANAKTSASSIYVFDSSNNNKIPILDEMIDYSCLFLNSSGD